MSHGHCTVSWLPCLGAPYNPKPQLPSQFPSPNFKQRVADLRLREVQTCEVAISKLAIGLFTYYDWFGRRSRVQAPSLLDGLDAT